MRQLRILIFYISAVLALGLLLGTGLVSGWGHWYSPSTPYRQQTEAFLNGRLALSYSVADVEHDMAWAEGGVHHVWGLGVPAWRLPFEAAARLAGQPAFPDRLALGVAVFLTGYLVLRVFTVRNSTGTIGDWIDGLRTHPERGIAVCLLLLFPPLLSMCLGPFKVYEEVVAYGYLYGLALFAGVVALHARPSLGVYGFLCLASGLIGFVRPTMLAYGLATVGIVFVLSRTWRWSWRRSIVGPLLFVAGGALLFYSNWIRFGSGFEFGHSLNMTGGEIYTTRFGAPFAKEPLVSAARELLGSLFFVKELNGFAIHASDVVAWQSDTIRWRHFYFSVFNVTYLAGLLACWALALRDGVGRMRGGLGDTQNPLLLLAGAWSLLAVLPMAGFYLNLFGMSSRYVMDFAPAIAVAMVGAFSGVAGLGRRFAGNHRLFSGVLVAVFLGWWVWEVATAESYFARTPVYTRDEALAATPRPTEPVARNSLPDEYVGGEDLSDYGIPYNGHRWANSGRTGAVVVVFAENPEFLVLEVAPADGEELSEDDYRRIRAKIGREHLALQAIEENGEGRVLRFSGPRRAAYRSGLQMVSLSFVLSDDYSDRWHPFVLQRVRWRGERDL